jgi:hypothetical protein
MFNVSVLIIVPGTEGYQRRNIMHLKDWEEKLNAFLKFNDRDILDNAGSISQEVTKELALEVYIDDVNRCKQ